MEQFPHSMEPGFRKLGLPTELKNGVIHLREDFVVCKEGQTLTPERADILKHFGHKLAEFRLEIMGHWHDSTWTQLCELEGDDGQQGDMDRDE